MRFLRALVIGLLSIFPGTIIGLIGWMLTGYAESNNSITVIFFCNVIPFGCVFLGFVWAWISGEEYGVNYQR